MLDFNSAATLVRMPGPKFVFIHIISPHEPFVFGADGKPIDPAPFMDQNQLYTQEQYTAAHQQQVPFVDMEFEKMFTTLISKSTRPLAIILQTDTGPLFTTGQDEFKDLERLLYAWTHRAALSGQLPSEFLSGCFQCIFWNGSTTVE